MFTGRGKGFRGRGQGNHGGTTKVPLKKGLFSDGIWQCNCDPRLPAQHFQTKNGGQNHGRWFYTCQKTQPKRCDFFLWDDEAKTREAAAVLNNSRTEPMKSPQTPSEPAPYGLVTPQTSTRFRDGSPEFVTPYTPSKTSYKVPSSSVVGNGTQATVTQGSDSEEEFYDWPASDDDALSKIADQASGPMVPPETPRKAIKADLYSTPGKRRYDEMAADDQDVSKAALPTPATGRIQDDIFTTPVVNSNGKGLFASGTVASPAETPTPIRYKDILPGQGSELATEVLAALQDHNASITPEVQETLKSICNKHVLYTRGIMKGRDVSRAMVKQKDERMTELQVEIEDLKAERETDRAVIRHLRRDIAVRKESEK